MTNHSLPVMQGTSTPLYKTLTNGQLLIGSTGADPSAAAITQGSGITVTNGAGSITIAASGGSGALTFIASVTASASATVDFANNLSSTYDNYFVIMENIVASSGAATLSVIVGTGGTPTWQSTNYAQSTYDLQGGTVTNGTTTSVLLNQQVFTTTSTLAAAGFLYVTNANNASNDKTILGQFAHNSGASMRLSQFNGQWQAATVITSLRFLMTAGNITTGTFKLYGISN